MTKANSAAQKQLNQLVAYLFTRRETMLNQWRTICTEKQSLNSKASFSREEFNDQAPVMLNIMAQRLSGKPDESNLIDRASEHGLHRWQRGYSLTELVTELEFLY